MTSNKVDPLDEYFERKNKGQVEKPVDPLDEYFEKKAQATAPVDIKPEQKVTTLTPSPDEEARKFYGTSAVAPPVQGVIPGVWSPAIAAEVGKKGFGPQPHGIDEFGRPVDSKGKPYYNEEAGYNVVAETLKGLYSLAANPMETYKGVADLVLTMPGFLAGMATATGAVIGEYAEDFANQPLFKYADQVLKTGDTSPIEGAKEEAKVLDLEHLYNVASENMGREMEFFEPAKRMLLGEPTKESQMVGEVAMAPIMALSYLGNAAADSKAFKDYPNVRGALRFAGDIVGLAVMGAVLRGPSARTKFSKEVSDITHKAVEIATKENAIDTAKLDSSIKEAQKKILHAEKVQLELRAEEAARQIKADATIMADLARMQRDTELAKVRPVRSAVQDRPKRKRPKVEKVKKGEVVEEPKVEPTDRLKNKPTDVEVPEVKPEQVETKAYHGTSSYFIKKGTDTLMPKSLGDIVNEALDSLELKGKDRKLVRDKILRSEYITEGDRSLVDKELYLADSFESAKPFADLAGEAYGQILFDLSKDTTLPKNVTERASKIYKEVMDSDKLIIEVDYNQPLKKGDNISKEPVKIKNIYEAEPKVVTPLDRKIGIEPTPEGLKGDKSPFYQDVETTDVYRKLYEEKGMDALREDPELFAGKLINDVNRYINGEDVPIEQVRNGLRNLAAQSDSLHEYFTTSSDREAFGSFVKEASEWASNVDRLKNKPTKAIEEADPFKEKPDWGDLDKREDSTLYSGVPPDKVIELVTKATKEFHKKFKQDIDDRVSKKIEKVNSYDKWEFSVGDRVRSEKTKRVYEITGKGWNTKTDEPLYYYKGGDEKGTFRANIAHNSLTKMTGPKLLSKGSNNELYAMIPLDKILEPLKKMSAKFSDFRKTSRENRKAKDFDLTHAVKQLKQDVNRSLVDNNETLFKMIRKKYPKDYQRLVDRFRSAAAGQGYGAVLYEQAAREVYGGKSTEMQHVIDDYILARRFKDIYSYRGASRYKHQKGYGPEEAVSGVEYLNLLCDMDPQAFKMVATRDPKFVENFGNLTQEQLREVKSAADASFEWHRKIVDDLVEAGLKSKEEGELLKAHDFRKFKSVRVEKLYDFDYNMELGGKKLPLTNSGVESLGWGSTKMIEPDGKVVMSEMFRRAYGSIANNVSKLEWKAFAEKHVDNGIVSLDKKGKADWSPMAFKENGETKHLYFHPDIAKYLVTKNADVSHRLSQTLQLLTAAKITRPLAVGLSPAWSTFVGLPMDVTHSLMTARKWNPEKGKFDLLYSPFMPKAALNIGIDLAAVSKDVLYRGPLTQSLYKHGLVMPFLATREGRYFRGTKPPGDVAKFLDLMSYHGQSMELGVRAATAHRFIKGKVKELGITYEEALQNKDIMYEAVHIARDRMDYNQGGWFIKAIDQNGFIFTNAATLGARTYWRQALSNPVDFTARTAQIMMTGAGIAATAAIMYPEAYKNIPKEGNEKNITWPLFPDTLKVKDRYGDDVGFYFKMRVDPGVAFQYKVAQALTETYLYDQGVIKNEPDYWKLVKNLKELGPVGLALPPSAQAYVDYKTNYSWWADRKMYTDMGGKTLPWPQSQLEGQEDRNVSTLAKKVGDVTKLSPKRLDSTIGNILPQNNEFVYMMGGAMEYALNDAPPDAVSDHWLLSLAKTPGFNRFIGIIRYNQDRYEVMRDINEDEEIKTMVRNTEFNSKLENYSTFKTETERDLLKYMHKYDTVEDEKIYKSMQQKLDFVNEPYYQALENRRFWLNFMDGANTGAKARTWNAMLDRSTEKEKAQLMKEWAMVYELGIINDEIMDKSMELRIREKNRSKIKQTSGQ